MPEYCNSAQLEHNWFHWLLSTSVPDLETYRKLGLLWTKVTGIATDADGVPIRKHGKTLPDPSHPVRTHCLALAMPIYFNSYHGTPQTTGTCFKRNRPVRYPLPKDNVLNLLSDSDFHRLDKPLHQLTEVIPSLHSKGYIREVPTHVTWHAMLEDVNRICHGIALRFKPKNDEEHQELTNDALIQVIHKLSNRKLIYTPGRAPVFNLLTTTIYRVMYSIMNRRKHQREGLGKILMEAEAGVLPECNRSLRVHSGHYKSIRPR